MPRFLPTHRGVRRLPWVAPDALSQCRRATASAAGARARFAVIRVQGRQRDEALESLERRRSHPYRSRILQASVNDPVSYPHEPVIREVVLQKLADILDRAIVTQRSTP